MSLDLQTSYPGATPPYAILRRPSDGYVWQTTTSTFVAPVDADVANYDVTLANLGLDRHGADVPSAVTAGSYAVDFYVYTSGTTPTITDFKLPSGYSFAWNGSAVTSTPSGSNLTTLPLVKDYAGVARSDTSQDTVLTARMQAASRLFEKITDRYFLSESRTEYPRGRGAYVSVNAYPITAVARVGLPVCAITISNTSSLNEQARVSCDGTTLTVRRVASGISNANDFTLASYATITALATAITALSNGWTATAGTTDYGQWGGSLIGPNQGSTDAKGGVDLILYSEQEVGNYEWDDETNTLWGCFPKNRKALVSYTGGYTTLPDDIQDAVAALAAAMHRLAGRDNTLASEQIGDYRYTNAPLGNILQEMRSLSPVAQLAVDFYKRRGL